MKGALGGVLGSWVAAALLTVFWPDRHAFLVCAVVMLAFHILFLSHLVAFVYWADRLLRPPGLACPVRFTRMESIMIYANLFRAFMRAKTEAAAGPARDHPA